MKKWWMESIGYQIYPKSFYDSNNDGFGDLIGIKEKLTYLKELGIDLIWICPFYDSPMDDNGYDVRDFFNVAKEFGTLEDFKLLLKEAKELNIKVILDFVLNHTSDEHEWFIESRSSIDNEKRNYYIWEKGRVAGGKELPPTNWGSFFTGSAWKRDETTNMYYMKIFSDKMPDLNWKNPKVREEMINVGKWWLDLGIDGFRIDAVSHLGREPFVEENKDNKIRLDWDKFSNLPVVHEYLKELNEKLFSKYDALAIGEVGGAASIDQGLKYSAYSSKELSMVFNFDHNWCNNLSEINSYDELKTNVKQLKLVFNNWQEAFADKGWLPLNWLNHDQPRLMSQYGNLEYFELSGKMLATALYFMRGTPFVYQGEEIGMTNYPFKKLSEFRDISSINHYNSLGDELTEDEKIWEVRKTSRDHPRTPIQWSNELFGGFSNVEPWININPNYEQINVENSLKDKNSIWYHYQSIFNLRKSVKYKNTVVYGTYQQLNLDDDKLYIYERESNEQIILVISNFTNTNTLYDISNYEIEEIVLSNYDNTKQNKNIINLRPFEAIVLQVRRN